MAGGQVRRFPVAGSQNVAVNNVERVTSSCGTSVEGPDGAVAAPEATRRTTRASARARGGL